MATIEGQTLWTSNRWHRSREMTDRRPTRRPNGVGGTTPAPHGNWTRDRGLTDCWGTGGPHRIELLQSLAGGRHRYIGPGMAMPKKLSLPGHRRTREWSADNPQTRKSLVTGWDLASNLASRQGGTQRSGWTQADIVDDGYSADLWR